MDSMIESCIVSALMDLSGDACAISPINYVM
jgi:hypothetical protein